MNEFVLSQILKGEAAVVTYAQRIVGLKHGNVEAKEMLSRFSSGNGQMRSVGDLLVDLSLAPEARVELDLLCLDTVFGTLARHPIPEHLTFVNLAPLTMEHPAFWKRLDGWLQDLAFPHHRVVFEITETQGMQNEEALDGNSRRLRDLGVRIAVDDLGSGIASLSHMARLAPDFIKVDRSLVHQVHRHPYQAALLNALAVFAQRMRVGYIVEGVETREELLAVIDADVPWGQGFLFGEPEPFTESGPLDVLEAPRPV